MNIYLVKRTGFNNIKTNYGNSIVTSFICYASNEHEAKNLSPECNVNYLGFPKEHVMSIDWNTTKGDLIVDVPPIFGDPFSSKTKIIKEVMYTNLTLSGSWVSNPDHLFATLLGTSLNTDPEVIMVRYDKEDVIRSHEILEIPEPIFVKEKPMYVIKGCESCKSCVKL